MQFRYQAIDGNGGKVSGKLEAGSEREAARELARQGLVVFALDEQHGVRDAREMLHPHLLRPGRRMQGVAEKHEAAQLSLPRWSGCRQAEVCRHM